HWAHGHRQGLEISRELDLPGARNLAFEFLCDFQTALVHAAARICRACIPVRTEVRIIVPIELHPLSHFCIGTTVKLQAVTLVGLDLELDPRLHFLALAVP